MLDLSKVTDRSKLTYYVYVKDPYKNPMRSQNDKDNKYLYVPFVSAIAEWNYDTLLPKAVGYEYAYEVAINYVDMFKYLKEDRLHQSTMLIGMAGQEPIIGSLFFIDNSQSPAYPKVMIQLNRGENWKYNIVHPIFSPLNLLKT